jgi:hypothetical protein
MVVSDRLEVALSFAAGPVVWIMLVWCRLLVDTVRLPKEARLMWWLAMVLMAEAL